MTRRFPAAFLLAALAGLLIAPSASAALCLRWESASRAPPGQTVAVAFRTLIPLASGEMKPEATRDYPFRVKAVSPSGASQRVQVARTADPQVWQGSFVAAEAGEWVVRVENFEPSSAVDPSCYEPLVLAVGDSSGSSGWWRWGAIAFGALLAVAVALRRACLRRTL